MSHQSQEPVNEPTLLTRVMTVVGNICTGVLLGAITVIAILVVLTRLDVGPYTLVVVNGGSMEPTIKYGDLAVFEKTTQSLKNGDVVLFNLMGDTVVHRVADIKEGCIRTKGDANKDEDPFCAQGIKGLYIMRIPVIGYLFIGFKNITGAARTIL